MGKVESQVSRPTGLCTNIPKEIREIGVKLTRGLPLTSAEQAKLERFRSGVPAMLIKAHMEIFQNDFTDVPNETEVVRISPFDKGNAW